MSNEVVDDSSTKVVMKQKLMTCEEVYLYKIPPLKDSGGHRAEDWDLAKPLQTCSLFVERRDDYLFVEFLDTVQKDPTTNQPAVFASSCIDLTINSKNRNMIYYIEQVMDSSRYYTIKIMNNQRTATIGFGFRERDDSIDFKEAIQFYENSIKREEQAVGHPATSSSSTDNATPNDSDDAVIANSKLASKYVIPKLQEGQKIHVNIKKKDHSNNNTTSSKQSNTKASGGLLLRKPPPSSDVQQTQQHEQPAPLSPITLSQPAGTASTTVSSPSSELIPSVTNSLQVLQLSNNDTSQPKHNQKESNANGNTFEDEVPSSGGDVANDDDDEWSEFQ